jgi:hypothetical protein
MNPCLFDDVFLGVVSQSRQEGTLRDMVICNCSFQSWDDDGEDEGERQEEEEDDDEEKEAI